MNPKILIADDYREHRDLLVEIVTDHTGYEPVIAANGTEALNICHRDSNELPALILLDIMMPEVDGFQVAERLRNLHHTRNIPIIFITALKDKESKKRISGISNADYISKPFKIREILARINTQLEFNRVANELKMKNHILENVESYLLNLVEQKTKKIEEVTLALVNALENASLLNDSETGNHVRRVSDYSALIAESYGCSRDFVNRLKLYASLHDIGKLGLPDSILKKNGHYTAKEYEEMKQHVLIGHKMLDDENIDEMAKNIVRYHHERWDGSGYREGLKAPGIPLEARIVALADVYDALHNPKPYRHACTEEETLSFIRENSGKHFDPELVGAFLDNKDKISGIDKQD
ncbi:MAG: HD domain-containing protein [bacterium]|nr:HD domain-containing protein [bacterium]